ncbi:aminoglycoside adenylyltransferase family protein [Actinomadura sp. 21ATH]|uniref:aminoglycoside adenylyltransferase family protein n=1 Tax=Actinomadura sp. 21ATH TaxID=1735444 RepID=UPI0035C18735
MTQTERVVRLAHEVLGPNLIGLYRHGSAVLGGLRATSDIDVLAVVRRPVTAGERRALVGGLLPISGMNDPLRPVEFTAVVRSAVRPWRYPPECEFQYGEWLRAEYERGHVPAPEPGPDLAPLLTMVLAGNSALYGPPPGEVLDPVPHEDLRRGITAGVPELLAELDDDTRNVVLTLARIWTTLATGEIRSKDAAAAWAIAHLPEEHRPVPSHARAVYLGTEAERWDGLRSRLRPYADHVTGELARLAEAPAPRG